MAFKTQNVMVHGIFLPCEYAVSKGVYEILSLGDVEREDIPLPGMIHHSLDAAATAFFDAIPDSRKVVVVIQCEDKAPELWPCKQALKRTLCSGVLV